MKPAFNKYKDGLVPAIIQDERSNKVLMLGYMNEAAWQKTSEGALVTFYSRSRQALWTKGETSGNFLYVRSLLLDCDSDCILVKAEPAGVVCHTGAATCFGEENEGAFLPRLETLIGKRIREQDKASYVAGLYKKGINKMAQKVGEEAVELVIEAKDDNLDLFKDEAADLLFHYLILLQAKGLRLPDITRVLEERHIKAVPVKE
jgi:phosphoribosyl-ATP pyrophosphohydrolase/phosphoribosyl-AMP cyclohydrolase